MMPKYGETGQDGSASLRLKGDVLISGSQPFFRNLLSLKDENHLGNGITSRELHMPPRRCPFRIRDGMADDVAAKH
jgi:hypothetical protein